MLPRCFRRAKRALLEVTLSAIWPVRDWMVVAMMSLIALFGNAMIDS